MIDREGGGGKRGEKKVERELDRALRDRGRGLYIYIYIYMCVCVTLSHWVARRTLLVAKHLGDPQRHGPKRKGV
jgi:hypothetical protein